MDADSRRVEFCTATLPRSGELVRIITEHNELRLAAQEPGQDKEALGELVRRKMTNEATYLTRF